MAPPSERQAGDEQQATAPTDDSRGFEQALAELEDHVRRLDGGDLPLEQALGLFETGVGLVRECQDLLDGAERRITELTETPDGVSEQPFQGGGKT